MQFISCDTSRYARFPAKRSLPSPAHAATAAAAAVAGAPSERTIYPSTEGRIHFVFSVTRTVCPSPPASLFPVSLSPASLACFPSRLSLSLLELAPFLSRRCLLEFCLRPARHATRDRHTSAPTGKERRKDGDKLTAAAVRAQASEEGDREEGKADREAGERENEGLE